MVTFQQLGGVFCSEIICGGDRDPGGSGLVCQPLLMARRRDGCPTGLAESSPAPCSRPVMNDRSVIEEIPASVTLRQAGDIFVSSERALVKNSQAVRDVIASASQIYI